MKKAEQQGLDEAVNRNVQERIKNLSQEWDGYHTLVSDNELKEMESRAKAKGIDLWKQMAWVAILKEIRGEQNVRP